MINKCKIKNITFLNILRLLFLDVEGKQFIADLATFTFTFNGIQLIFIQIRQFGSIRKY